MRRWPRSAGLRSQREPLSRCCCGRRRIRSSRRGLIGGAVILLFGAWDDRVGLGYKAKFLGQLIAAAVVVWVGGVHLSTLPFMGETPLPLWIAVPVTLFLLVAVTNALNLADGLDGLAGGLSLLSFGGMAFLAYLAGDWVVMSMMVAVLGGLLGFLRFNTYPASIFMGDAGSQFLGFYLGLCAIVLTDPARGPYSPALLSLHLGAPDPGYGRCDDPAIGGTAFPIRGGQEPCAPQTVRARTVAS